MRGFQMGSIKDCGKANAECLHSLPPSGPLSRRIYLVKFKFISGSGTEEWTQL